MSTGLVVAEVATAILIVRTVAPTRGGAALAVMIEAERATPMNPNKALWEKGDFTRIAQT